MQSKEKIQGLEAEAVSHVFKPCKKKQKQKK